MRTSTATIETLEARNYLSVGVVSLTTVPAALPPVGSVVLPVHLRNPTHAAIAASATITVYGSTDRTLDATDVELDSMSASIILRRGETTVPVNIPSPVNLARGKYFLIADAQISGAFTGLAVSRFAVLIQPPIMDVAISAVAAPLRPILLSHPSLPRRVQARLVNSGNVPVSIQGSVQFYLSKDASLDQTDPLLATVSRSRPSATSPVTAQPRRPAT